MAGKNRQKTNQQRALFRTARSLRRAVFRFMTAFWTIANTILFNLHNYSLNLTIIGGFRLFCVSQITNLKDLGK